MPRGRKFGTNTETDGRFHSKWLNMMYPRLYLARNLLHEEGTLFVSCDDHEVHTLRGLLNEVFGEEQFVSTVIWEKSDSPRNSARQFSEDHDFVLVYSRQADWIPRRLARTDEANAIYSNPDNDSRGPWLPGDPFANNPYSKGLYSVTGPTGRSFSPPPGRYWRVSEERLRELDAQGRIYWGTKGDARPSIKRYLSEVADLVPRTLWKKEDVGSNRTSKNEMRDLFPDVESFDTPKPLRLVQRMLAISTLPDEHDVVLDFFAGSGTTGHAVLQQNREDRGNRRFVLIQLPEPTGRREFSTIADICRKRLRTAGERVRSEDAGALKLDSGPPPDYGFRALKLAESNFRPWQADASKDAPALGQQLALHVSHILPGRTQEDILYEILLKCGFPLTARVETVTMEGKTVYSVADGALLVCLERELTLELIRGLAERKPERVVCLDAGFAGNDPLKANAVKIFQAKDVKSFRTV